MQSAFIFFGGMADLFLTVMLWFILDSEKTVNLMLDGERVYAVTNVIKANDSSVNIDCLEEDE
jgi:hypothetical protein